MSLLRDLRIYNDGSVEVASVVDPPPSSGRLPVIPYALGIIKMGTGPLERTFDPQSMQLMDYPKGTNKGHTAIIPWEWLNYSSKLQTLPAYRWMIGPNNMMTNKRHMYDGELPFENEPCRFECIGLNLNYAAFSRFTATHGLIVCRSTAFNPSALDPMKNNWYYEPHLVWKASMRNAEGDVRNVGSGLNVYVPNLTQLPERWANLADIEMLPALPFDIWYEGKLEHVTGYCLLGTSVLGHAETRDIWLRKVTKPGEWIQHPDWRLVTKPVVPEVRAEWN